MKLFCDLSCGDINVSPFAVFNGEKRVDVNYVKAENNGIIQLSGSTQDFIDRLYITKTNAGYVVKRTFKNVSKNVLCLKELGVDFDGISFNKDSKKDYFYHAENARIYLTFTFPIDYKRTTADAANSEFDVQANNKWADPNVVSEKIGASPYQPFPAILISNYDSKQGLVHGTLSQDVFYHNYLVKHTDLGVLLTAYSSFKAISYREVKPSETLVDEWFIGNTENADNIERIFSNYTKELRKKLPVNYGSTKINRDNVLWGSWNDGIFRDVSEDMLISEAKAIKEEFPTAKWLQLDDGYTTFSESAHGLCAPYEGEEGFDEQKFPSGLRGYSDKLRLTGLRPAIWIGGHCDKKTKIYTEHPEWFSDFTYRMDAGVLDVSQQEVRDYIVSALDLLVKDFAFDGVKFDFWSYAFEESSSVLKNKTASGYEYRKWLLKEFRKRLPADGYFQSCCDLAMGNPFLGEYFTNYRYGIDIGVGNWEHIKTNFLWGTACFSTHTGDLFVPNSDSIGMFPGLSDIDAQFCVNYILMTRTMVEITGRISQADKESARFKMMKKATCNLNNGQDVYFVNFDYRKKGVNVPEILYFNTPHFTNESVSGLPLKTVGLFNTEESEKTFKFSAKDLGLPNGKYVLTDIWTGEQTAIENCATIVLKAHGSKVLSVNEDNGTQIFDANLKMENVVISEEKIVFNNAYKYNAEIKLNKTAKNILLDGEEIAFTVSGGLIDCTLKKAGNIEILF